MPVAPDSLMSVVQMSQTAYPFPRPVVGAACTLLVAMWGTAACGADTQDGDDGSGGTSSSTMSSASGGTTSSSSIMTSSSSSSAGEYDIVFQHPITELDAAPHWPLGNGSIHAEPFVFQQVPTAVLTDPATRIYLYLDLFLNDVSYELSFQYFFVQAMAHPTKCYLSIVDAVVKPNVPLVTGTVWDETRGIELPIAQLGGAGLYPESKLEGVNIFDVTDAAVAGDCGDFKTLREAVLAKPTKGAWVEYMYIGYGGIIRDAALYVGHPGKP